MYLAFFEIESKPFQITADPGFLWLGDKHKEALATLRCLCNAGEWTRIELF